MGYTKDLKVNNRKLTDHVVIASCPYMLFNALNFGARMAVFEYDGSILVWSAIPYSDAVKSLQLLTGRSEGFNVTHLIVPNTEHTVAAASFKEAFPNIKVLASEHVVIPGVKADYLFKEEHTNRIIGKAELQSEFGIEDKILLDNFEFVYLSNHKNKEVVVFDKTSKNLFVSDLMSNLGAPGTTSGEVTLEQFSPEVGYPNGFNPHGGLSFLTRYLQPDSKVGGFLSSRLSGGLASGAALKLIHSWNFHTVIMSHGNIITENARNVFENSFGKFWKEA